MGGSIGKLELARPTKRYYPFSGVLSIASDAVLRLIKNSPISGGVLKI